MSRPATRGTHLVRVLASFPHAPATAYEAPSYKKPPTDPGDGERPASLALAPLQMAAAKDAEEKTADGNLTALVIDAMESKADALGMRSPRATTPTFGTYPAAALLSLQRNIEEPALALIAAHEQRAERLKGGRGEAGLVESVRASGDKLLQALVAIEVEA